MAGGGLDGPLRDLPPGRNAAAKPRLGAEHPGDEARVNRARAAEARHRDQQIRGYPFDPWALVTCARRAAAAFGLEVFGGDAIVTPRGHLVLIDLNAWPSFALYRDEAAAEIAAYLVGRFTRG